MTGAPGVLGLKLCSLEYLPGDQFSSCFHIQQLKPGILTIVKGIDCATVLPPAPTQKQNMPTTKNPQRGQPCLKHDNVM